MVCIPSEYDPRSNVRIPDGPGGHNRYQLTPSEEERAQVHMDSTSSSSVHIDALTFGQIPPRAVSTLFKQI